MFVAKATQQSQNLIDKAMESLSTGKRINYAKDDAAGSAIAVRLTAEIQGLQMASRNAADGQSLLDTAEGALTRDTHLMRLRELAVQSSNGTLTTSDRGALQAEAAALEAEITRISDTTSWVELSFIALMTVLPSRPVLKKGDIVASILDMAATAATIAISVGFTWFLYKCPELSQCRWKYL